MATLFHREISTRRQFLFSLLLVLAVSALCYTLTGYIGYRVVAFILLLAVSLLAVSFDILPVLFAATLSALVWDLFFIPPRFNLHVHTTEDAILLIMYFVIALINAVLTFKIRQVEAVARQREERANAVKLYDAFLNSLSHELRTPIAVIVGATDNLQAGNENLTEGIKAELIAEISKASLRLNQQVENLLNVSRLESGFLKPGNDWCDIPELLHTVVKSVEETCSDINVHIFTEPDIPLFRLDKVMAEQVLYNLIQNACVHTPANSTIHVSASCRAGALRLVVEDNGAGFPEDEIDLVFDKFYRLKQTTATGTGLGLAIVKGFTEALGGTIQLRNLPAGGCRFTVDIPAETSYLKV